MLGVTVVVSQSVEHDEVMFIHNAHSCLFASLVKKGLILKARYSLCILNSKTYDEHVSFRTQNFEDGVCDIVHLVHVTAVVA